MPRVVTIVGMPGAGKTRLALGVGGALMARGESVLVLHTDLLKVTLRHVDARWPRGPAYQGDIAARCVSVRPILVAHALKAARDGYRLVVEGTLALGFCPADGLMLWLDLPECDRRERSEAKHPSAAAALRGADLAAYGVALDATTADAVRLDARQAPERLVAAAMEVACAVS